MGLEPMTSALTVQYSNQLNYSPFLVENVGNDPTFLDFQSNANPSQLTFLNFGGIDETRTRSFFRDREGF
jgi:hypothetical protein